MPRVNEEVLAFHEAVYAEVQKIPSGRVTSYGHIAKLIFRPQNPRQVGISLKQLPADKYATVPWWRVVNYKGVISPRDGGVMSQVDKLQLEDVAVGNSTDGTYIVDLSTYGWFPETEFDDSDDDDE